MIISLLILCPPGMYRFLFQSFGSSLYFQYGTMMYLIVFEDERHLKENILVITENLGLLLISKSLAISKCKTLH